MSRIGKRPVVLPAGVKVEAVNGVLTVTGKLGKLARPIPGKLAVEVKDGTATVVLLDKDAGNLYGMYRTILANMVQGVTDGFLRILEIVGVGYKAESKGGALHLALGYSHPVVFPLPAGVTAQVESNTVIKLSGFDKEVLGETAARVRMLRKPDVYKNKGIRYRGERLIKKVGKAAGK
jgi:large subunit ribosomal protein L6